VQIVLFTLLPPIGSGLVWGLLCYGLCLRRLVAAPGVISRAAFACMGYACALVFVWWGHRVLVTSAHPPAWALSLFTYPESWLSKGLSLLWSVPVLVGLRWLTPLEAGLRAPQPGSLLPVGLVVVVVAVGLLANAYATGHEALTWLPEQIYVATLPGLVEEVFYRGVLLGLLNRAFLRTIPLPGTRTSWGGVVGILLFILGHALKFPAFLPSIVYQFAHGTIEPGFELWPYINAWLFPTAFSLGDLLYFTAMGTLFLWVRERTGSCWAAAGAHCLMNSCLVIGKAIS
jgi:membrane protease YdiL (CAAX protease family)